MYMCTRAATTHTLTRVNNMIHALKRRYTHVRTRAYTPHTKTLDAYPHARTPHSHITIYLYAYAYNKTHLLINQTGRNTLLSNTNLLRY